MWLGDRRPEVTVRGATTRRPPGHPRATAPTTSTPEDVTRHQGIPVTTPARTLRRPRRRSSTYDAAPPRARARPRRCASSTSPQLAETLARPRPRRGAANLAQILATGPAPTRSELEDVVLDLILRGGLAHPDVNVPLTIGGRRVVPDFRWPEQRLVVEADGAAWHDDQLAREDDAERQALLEAARRAGRARHLGAGGAPAGPQTLARHPRRRRAVRLALIGR